MALNISFIYVKGYEKRTPKQIHKPRPNFRFGKLKIVILNKSSCSQAIYQASH